MHRMRYAAPTGAPPRSPNCAPPGVSAAPPQHRPSAFASRALQEPHHEQPQSMDAGAGGTDLPLPAAARSGVAAARRRADHRAGGSRPGGRCRARGSRGSGGASAAARGSIRQSCRTGRTPVARQQPQLPGRHLMRGVDLNDRLVASASAGSGGLVPPVPAALRDPASQVAAEVAALQSQLPAVQDDPLWIALSPPADAGLPGELLRQLRAAGHAVQGFVDRTALLAAWLDAGHALAVLEMTRRHFAIGYATRDTEAAALRRHVPLPGGELALEDAWLRLAAATLVQQTRFDPLHDLQREAALR